MQKNRRASTRRRAPLVVAELFSGAGGLSAGFRLAKAFWPKNKGEAYRVAYGVDHDEEAIQAFRNYHFHNSDATELALVAPCQDVAKVTKASILQAIRPRKRLDILIGGPSCQGVSTAGLRNPEDHRNDMLRAFIRLVRELQPRWFLMENVPGLTHANNRQLLRDVFKNLESIKGYKVAGDVLLAADYGVPQFRYRLFIIGTNTGAPIRFPTPTHGANYHAGLPSYRTVRDAIYDLSKRKARQFDKTTLPKEKLSHRNALHNHYCPNISEVNKKRIKRIAGGEDWRSLPIRLLPDRYFATRASDQKGCYGRLVWNWPAYTITNACSNITAGPFTHPKFDRVLSVREAARLQSFADDHVFFGSIGSQYKQVGNAVPPVLAKAVAEGILLCNYQHRQAAKWGREGRLTYRCINDAIKAKIPFPELTRRHVHPSGGRRKNLSTLSQRPTRSVGRRKSTWDLKRRPKDANSLATLRLRKLASQPGNYRATRRARAIVHFLDGKPKNDIVKAANASEASVRKWIDSYYLGGLDGWRAYHKPVANMHLKDRTLSSKVTKAILRVRRTLLSASNRGDASESARLHMNAYLRALVRRFGTYSVGQLMMRVERKLNVHLGTVYVGDLLAIADVAFNSAGRRVPQSSKSSLASATLPKNNRRVTKVPSLDKLAA